MNHISISMTVYKNPDKICQDYFLKSQDFFLRKCQFTKNPDKSVLKRNPDKIITKNPDERKFEMEIYNFGPHRTLSLHELNEFFEFNDHFYKYKTDNV